jgi:hypothetical protein
VSARAKPKTKRATRPPAQHTREQVVPVRLVDLLRWYAELAEAQELAIKAAPREIPVSGFGAVAALGAFDKLHFIRQGIGTVISGRQTETDGAS